MGALWRGGPGREPKRRRSLRPRASLRRQPLSVETLEGRALLTTGPTALAQPLFNPAASDALVIAALSPEPPPPDGSGQESQDATPISRDRDQPPVFVPITVLAPTSLPLSKLAPVFTVKYEAGDALLDPSSNQVMFSSPFVGSAGNAQPLPNSELEAELTPDGIQQLQFVPGVETYSVRGALDSDHYWTTYRMPVGPRTHSLRVSLNPGPEAVGGNVRPAVNELYLVGPNGLILAQLTSAAANWNGDRQELTISLDGVPDGAQLLVRIVEMPAAGSGADASSPAANSDSTGPVSFVMDVTRAESSSASPTPDGVPSGPSVPSTWVGSLPASPTTGPSPYSSQPSTTPAQPSNTKAAIPDGAAPDRNSADDAASTELGAVDAPLPGVGPMISVGSAPIGPAPGRSRGDTIVSLDRNERAFDLALEESSAGIDPELIPGVVARYLAAHPGRDDQASGGQPSESPVLVAFLGPGGYPILGSAPGHPGAPLSARDVLATLDPSQPEPGVREGIADGPGLRPLDTEEPPASARRRPLPADLATAACGLLLGIGLTSGPFSPDLLALLQRRHRSRAADVTRIRRRGGRFRGLLRKLSGLLR